MLGENWPAASLRPVSMDSTDSNRFGEKARSERGRASKEHRNNSIAITTAHIVAEAVGAKTKSVAELAEPDLGLIDGLTEKGFAERFPKRYKQWQEDPLSLLPPEGEAFGDAQARIFRACAKILRRSRGDRTAIVLHPLALGFVRCWLADRPACDVPVSLGGRPQIEQYLVAQELVESLEQAARAEPLNA